MTDQEKQIERLFERATEKIEMVTTKADEDELGPVLSLLDDLEDIADEAEDILSTVDLTELAGAVDWKRLPEAIELRDLPDAIEEGEASEAVSLRKLVELTNLSQVWASSDTREAWREMREFDDEFDDLTGDGDGEGQERDGSTPDVGAHDFDPESVENAVQSQVSDAVGAFREKLLVAHERLRRVRERNAERFPDRRGKRSRNPTAVSTMPTGGPTSGGTTSHSTVPEETRYSKAPNRPRIYGPRFESAGGDDRG